MASVRFYRYVLVVGMFSTFLYYTLVFNRYVKERQETFDNELFSRFEDRRSKLNSVCARMESTSVKSKVFYAWEPRLCYCGTAKSGCTFWKQIIRFLNHDTRGLNFSHPLDIPRSWVHFHFQIPPVRFLDELFSDHVRFMFVRDPYSRLWSAYIDKIFLPDYWKHAHVRSLRGLNTCYSNITFEESLKWALDTPLKTMDAHWVPISFACGPCHFQPEYIGKQETFSEDVRHILSQYDLTWILDTRPSHSENEVRMLISYNFNLLSNDAVSRCTDKRDLARRLWKAFQINGHISSDKQFPFEQDDAVDENTFTETVLDVITTQGMSAAKRKAQKLMYMREAFKSLPLTTVNAIRNRYALDFEMFDYDPHNSDLF